MLALGLLALARMTEKHAPQVAGPLLLARLEGRGPAAPDPSLIA